MREALILLAAVIAGSLAYGYWHRNAYATLSVVVTDAAAKADSGKALNAEIVFLDAGSKVLARGKTDDKFGFVLVEHPSAGYCGPGLPREAYRACFGAQSGWLAQWVKDLRYVSLVMGACRIERVPLEVSVLRDSLLTWWIPLPHVGGVPYTHYSAQLEVDSRVCAVTGRRG